MDKTIKIMLCIAIIAISVASGGKVENFHQKHRKNIITKHIEISSHSQKYKDVSIEADIKYLWVDSNCQRNDRVDERVCLSGKLHGALIQSIKDFNNSGTVDNIYTLYLNISKHFVNLDNPFNDGRDWVSLRIKSITYKNKEGIDITANVSHVVFNPYYVDNYYFQKYHIVPRK